MNFQDLMKQARAYSSALDQRDEQERLAQQVRMRNQTIQSMQTKKYELDEKKLGVSQPRTQYVSALPILDTVDSVVHQAPKQNTPVGQGFKKALQQYAPAPTLANASGRNNYLSKSNPVVNSFQTAMPNASLVQQATNNFQQWNKKYKQDEDQYIDAVDRVASLAGWGAPPDEEANRQLEESEAKLNQTKEQEDSMLRQTLTMLGPGAEEIIKAAYKDAIDQPGAGYKVQYTQEETARRTKNQKRAQELRNLIGADLYGKLYNYVYEQDTAAKAAKKQREEEEAAAERRHRLEAKYYTLSSVSASKDFDEKSQYRSKAKDRKPSLMTRLIDNAVYGDTSDWDDPLYEAVNGNEEARAYLRTKASNIYGAEGGALGSLYGSATEDKREVKQMTEKQVGVFNYLYATKGKEVAHEYYDILQELELNPKQRAEEEAYWQQEAEKHPVGSSIFSVAVSPLKSLPAAGQFADYITTGKIDENAGYNSFARIPSKIRSTVSQKAEEKWGPAGSFLYQTGMSMADFLYKSALTGAWAGEEALGKEAFRIASNMSLAIMGSGAAADATIEAKERGLTDKQAFVLGTVAGAAEILTEKVSVESLLTGKWEDSAIKFILKNSLVEGSEEVGSDVINMVADVLVAKDKSQWKQSIQAYRNSGLSEEEAFRRAMMDQALEMGLDYLGGAISGGVMAGMQAWGNRGYWQAQQAPRQTGSTDTNQSGFQTNTQAQTLQDVQQNPFEAKRTPQVQETKAERVQLSERAQQLAQRMAALGEDGETAVELAMDIEGYFWGDVTDEDTVQRLVNNPAAESVMEWLLDQGERPGQMAAGNVQSEQNNQSQQAQEDQLNEAIRNAMEQLDRQQRAANARNETERTGILAGAKTGQIEQAQRLGELVGREVAFFSEGKDAAGGMRNGYYNQQDGRIYVNANSQNPTAQIISHELTHSIEDNGYYTQLKQTVLKKLVEDGGNLDTLRAEKQAIYERHGVTDVDVDAEIVAEYVEKNLLSDEQSIQSLVQENRTLGQRIMEFIDRLLAKLGNKNAQERAFLSKARRYYRDALEQSRTSGTAMQQERVRSMEQLQAQMASGELTEDEAWQVFNEIYDAEADLQNGLRGNQYSYSPESTDVDVETSRKKQQFEIVQNSNAAEDDYHYDVTDMKPTSFQIRTEPSTAAASISTASAIKEDSAIDNIAEEAEFGKGKFSISEEENLSDLDRAQMAAMESLKEDAQRAETEKLRQALPVKARQYLARAERVLLANVQNALGVDKFSDKAGLMGTIQEISNEYLKHGKLTQERADALFEKAYKQGVVTEKEFYQRYKGIKDKLRTTAITLDEGYRSRIPDYRDFRQSAFGRLRLVNEGGMSVDSLYQELQQQAPELFPDSITNPADQLVQMFEVSKSIQISERTISESMGKDADEFKRWAKNDFESAVSDLASDLRSVSRYAQEQASKTQKMTAPTTPEEAMKAYGELKQARWTAEKAKAKNLLTDRDRMQVGRLLKGEIELGDLEAGKDNVQGIRAVYEASKEYDGLVKQLNQYKRQQRAKLQEKAQGYLKDALLWKDKPAGILYSREIMERNIRDIAPDKATADAVIREYFTPVHKAEAKSNRFQDAYRDRVREMDLSRKVQKGNKVSEAYAVQLLGEAEDNIRMIEKSKGRIQKRDGETAGAWRGIIETLRAENPNLDWTKVEGAVKEFRTIYDELFRQINEVRVRNGYEPINYRSGYFPHFQAQSDSILEQMGRAIGIDSQVETLPTSINGITGEFKPGIAWFKFGQQRTGYQTAYDAVEGFDKYIKSAADVIHHTDNIQNLRAFATEIRYMTGDEGMRKQMDAIRADQTLTEEEKRAKLEDLYKNGKFTLSNYVNELEEYTNNLANKKSKLDRGMEAMIGRRAYTIMKNFESRVGANMVAGNLASAFTNFIPLTQAGAQIDKASLLRGMWDTLKAYKRNDGFADQSTFLTNRRGSDPIVQTWLSKASKVMGTPMNYIDNFTADSIVRARFRQNMRRGMSETLAMEEADSFAALVMADRSKGAQPTLFNATNPMVKAFTQFQLEVNNQFSEVFKDLPRAYKDKGLAALAAALLQYFFGAYLYNEVYEKIVGRRPALDPLGILNDTVGDLTGYELPNLVTLAGNTIQGKKTSFEKEKVGFGEAGKNLTQNVLGELPFSSGLTLLGVDLDGGRIPASSAIPDLTALWDAATTEDWSGKKRWDETKKELNKLAYVIPPFGGNQIGKGVKTVKQLTKGGKYTVDADGNDVLQYPIDNTPGNWVRGMLFGPSSLPESQAYYNGNQKALTGEQTAVVKELTGQGVDQKIVYDLYQELRKIGKEKKGAEAGNAKRDAINALDLTDAQKLQVFAATMLDNKSEKYEETLGQYQAMMDAGLNWDEITQANNMYASLNADDDRKASEKARELELWIDDQDWTPEQEAAVKEKFRFWTMRQAEAAEGSDKYEYMQERLAGGTPPETVLMALSEKQQENYSKHLNPAKVSAEVYLDALNFASKAKTDEDGQTKKEKVVAYINGLKLTRKQKRALYLCFYSEKDDTFK